MNKRTLLAALATAALAACSGPNTTSPTAASAAPVDATPQAMAQRTTGFTAGSMMAARTAYVFFDPQCPHCATLWESSKALHPQLKFVWVPVAILSKASGPQGATILGAKDPVAAMNEHEELLRAHRGGITAVASSAELQAAVAKNTEAMNAFGVSSVPYIVAAHAKTGEAVRVAGAVPPAMLAERLGLAAPAAH